MLVEFDSYRNPIPAGSDEGYEVVPSIIDYPMGRLIWDLSDTRQIDGYTYSVKFNRIYMEQFNDVMWGCREKVDEMTEWVKDQIESSPEVGDSYDDISTRFVLSGRLDKYGYEFIPENIRKELLMVWILINTKEVSNEYNFPLEKLNPFSRELLNTSLRELEESGMSYGHIICRAIEISDEILSRETDVSKDSIKTTLSEEDLLILMYIARRFDKFHSLNNVMDPQKYQ